MKRGEVWTADLDPVRGSEQAGKRPVVVLQTDPFSVQFPSRVVVPFTSNLRYQHLACCVLVAAGEGGLSVDSLAMCHQTRVCDASRFLKLLGQLSDPTLARIEAALRITLGL